MNILLIIVLALAGLVVLVLLVALFTKKEFEVRSSIVIEKPRPEVFAYVRQIKNQEHYTVWALRDPKAIRTYTGTDGTLGFIAAWSSQDKNVGVGEQEIVELIEEERIGVEIRFTEPFVSTDPAYTTTERVGENQTRVTNVYLGKIPWPMNLICPFIAKKIGADMQSNLDNLKRILETS